MTQKLVQVKFSKIMQTRAYTVIVLGTEDKKFAIYTEPHVGHLLQLHLTGVNRTRPLTHDLFADTLIGLDVQLRQVVINDVQDTIYMARLYMEQDIDGEKHIVEVDGRPSDCLSLALLQGVPVFATEEVLDKSLPVEE